MERLSDDEFWAGQSPASRAHLPLVTSPLSSPLDTPSLRRVLELPVNRPDTGIEIEETNSNDDQVIEEEEQEVVRSLGGVSSRLQYKMAAVMEELRTQRMGVGTFIRAWIEQDDIMRTRRICSGDVTIWVYSHRRISLTKAGFFCLVSWDTKHAFVPATPYVLTWSACSSPSLDSGTN
jgi:hypothetical protein